MLRLVLIPTLLALALADEGPDATTTTTTTPPETKAQCMADLVEWCNNMTYPVNSTGMSISSVVFNDGAKFYRMLCITDAQGTNCTRNGAPWIVCTPSKEFYYKGVKVGPDTPVDDDVCESKNIAFNNMGLGGTKFDDTAIKEAMQHFNKQMKEFNERMRRLRERMFNMRRNMFDVFGHHDDDDSSDESRELEREN